jgi:hypothetical protein
MSKSSTERSREFRHRLRQDPSRRAAALAKRRERYLQRTPVQKQLESDRSRERFRPGGKGYRSRLVARLLALVDRAFCQSADVDN